MKNSMFSNILTPFLVLSQSNRTITALFKYSSAKWVFRIVILMTGQYKVMAELLPRHRKCYVVQRYKGIEIFRAVSIFNKEHWSCWCSKRIVDGISKKVNTTKPAITVVALTKAYVLLGIKGTKLSLF
jgi:hypothetical protein